MARKLLKISTLLLAIILVFTGCEFLQENLSAELLDAQNASIGDASVAVSTINYLGANDTTGTIVAEFTQGVDFAKDADGNDKALAGTAEFTYTAASLETDDDGARTGELTLPTTLDGKKLPFAIDTALAAMPNATLDGISVSLIDIAGFVSTETEVKDRKLPAFSASFNIVPLFDETEATCSDLTQTVKSFALNSDPSEALLATTGLTLTGADSYTFSEDEGVHYLNITLTSADLVDGATLNITLSGLKDKNRADMSAVSMPFTVVVDLAANDFPACAIRGSIVDSSWNPRVLAEGTYGLWVGAIDVVTAGTYQFKFDMTADQSWGDSGVDNFGYGQITDTDSTINITEAGGNFEAAFEVGTYFILVNERDSAATDTDKLSFTITKAGTNVAGSTFSTAVIKGGMNSWSTTDPWVMTYLGAETWLYYNNYTTAVTQAFKFDDSAAWDSANEIGSVATGLPDDSGNISLEFAADEYIFCLNEEKPLRSVVETL